MIRDLIQSVGPLAHSTKRYAIHYLFHAHRHSNTIGNYVKIVCCTRPLRLFSAECHSSMCAALFVVVVVLFRCIALTLAIFSGEFFSLFFRRRHRCCRRAWGWRCKTVNMESRIQSYEMESEISGKSIPNESLGIPICNMRPVFRLKKECRAYSKRKGQKKKKKIWKKARTDIQIGLLNTKMEKKYICQNDAETKSGLEFSWNLISQKGSQFTSISLYWTMR